MSAFFRYCLLAIIGLCLMSFGSSRLVAQSGDVKVSATIVKNGNEYAGDATFHGSGTQGADTGSFTGPGTETGAVYTWQKDGSNFKVYKNGTLWWTYVGVGNSAKTAGTVEGSGNPPGGGGWTR